MYNEFMFYFLKVVVVFMMQCWDDVDIIGMDLMSDSFFFFSFVCCFFGWNCLWFLKVWDVMLLFKWEISGIVFLVDFQCIVECIVCFEIIVENYGSFRVVQLVFFD